MFPFNMILRQYKLKRLVPFILCLILLKLLVLREDGGGKDYSMNRNGEAKLPHPLQAANVSIITSQVQVAADQQIDGSKTNHNRHSPVQSLRYITVPSVGQEELKIPVRYRLIANESSTSEGTMNNWDGNKSYKSGNTPMWMRFTDDIYTYNAFWDSRDGLSPAGPVARLLGLLKYRRNLMQEKLGNKVTGYVKEDLLNCSCLLWYTGQGYKEGVLHAFVYEEGLKMYVGTYFLCYPMMPSSDFSSKGNSYVNTNSKTENINHIPYAVSLVSHGATNSIHKLIYLMTGDLLIKNEPLSRKNSSAVCVRPLFGPYSDLKGIVQFISYYNTVLRVSHFYFYDLAIDRKIKDFLKKLAGADISVQILPWNVPTSEWDELWDLGSLTALNDCIYRSTGLHHHVATVDLDEFIVPRTPVTSLGEVYQNILKYKHGTEGDAALISNVFYCSEFENSTKLSEEIFPIFQHRNRETRMWPAKSRSKIVLVPEAVLSAGHHMVHNFLEKHMTNRASPKHVSVLHHYRSCSQIRLGMHGTGKLVLEGQHVMDTAIFYYKHKVLTSPTVALYKKFLMGNS